MLKTKIERVNVDLVLIKEMLLCLLINCLASCLTKQSSAFWSFFKVGFLWLFDNSSLFSALLECEMKNKDLKTGTLWEPLYGGFQRKPFVANDDASSS